MACENQDRFRTLSIRAADCFAKDLTPVGRIEHVYHLFGGDPDRGAIALEGLLTLAEEKSGPMNSSVPPRDVPKKFLVAFSFAGEHRDLVHSIAEAVEQHLGRSKVFLDEWYEDCIAGDDADIFLQDIYRKGCVLAVICVSNRYGHKPWTLAEHAAIRERVNRSRVLSRNSRNDKARLGVLPIRVGVGNVKGIDFLTTAFVPDVRPPAKLEDAVELILNRLWRAQNLEATKLEPGASRVSQKTGSRVERRPG
jgi:TIR domain